MTFGGFISCVDCFEVTSGGVYLEFSNIEDGCQR